MKADRNNDNRLKAPVRIEPPVQRETGIERNRPDIIVLPPPWSHLYGKAVLPYLGIDQTQLSHLIAAAVGAAITFETIYQDGKPFKRAEVELPGGIPLIVEIFVANNKLKDRIYRLRAKDWIITARWAQESRGRNTETISIYYSGIKKSGRIDGVGKAGDDAAFLRDIAILLMFGAIPPRNTNITWF